MEENIFHLPEVAAEFRGFILTKLYTDRGTEGDKRNIKLLTEMTKSSSLPTYAIVSPDGKVLKVLQGMERDQKLFANFLKDGHDNYSRVAAKP